MQKFVQALVSWYNKHMCKFKIAFHPMAQDSNCRPMLHARNNKHWLLPSQLLTLSVHNQHTIHAHIIALLAAEQHMFEIDQSCLSQAGKAPHCSCTSPAMNTTIALASLGKGTYHHMLPHSTAVGFAVLAQLTIHMPSRALTNYSNTLVTWCLWCIISSVAEHQSPAVNTV